MKTQTQMGVERRARDDRQRAMGTGATILGSGTDPNEAAIQACANHKALQALAASMGVPRYRDYTTGRRDDLIQAIRAAGRRQ